MNFSNISQEICLLINQNGTELLKNKLIIYSPKTRAIIGFIFIGTLVEI